MRTGAIFARGSCRALKWMALFGVVFALGAGSAVAQTVIGIESAVLEPRGSARGTHAVSGRNTAIQEVGEGATTYLVVTLTKAVPSNNDANTTLEIEVELDVAGVIGDPATRADVATTDTTGMAEAMDFVSIAGVARASLTGFGTTDGAASANIIGAGAAAADTSTGPFFREGERVIRIPLRLGTDSDAFDEDFTITVRLEAQTDFKNNGSGAHEVLRSADASEMAKTISARIVDIQDQAFELVLATNVHPREGGPFSVDLLAQPTLPDVETVELFVELDTGDEDDDYELDGPASNWTALSDSTKAGSTVASMANSRIMLTVMPPSNDKNRDDDEIMITVYDDRRARANEEDTLTINVEDQHHLPDGDDIGAKAFDMADADKGREIEEAEEGETFYLEVEVDRGTVTDQVFDSEIYTVSLEAADSSQKNDFRVTPAKLVVPAGAGKVKAHEDVNDSAPARFAVELIDEDDDVNDMMLMLNVVVAGEMSACKPKYGPGTAVGMFEIAVMDSTAKLIRPKSDADVARELGDNTMLVQGEQFELDADRLFVRAEDIALGDVAFSAVSSDMAVVDVAVSGGSMLHFTAMADGTTTVTVTGTVTPSGSSAVMQTSSRIAQVAFDLTVDGPALTFTLKANSDVLVEGERLPVTLTAEASRTVIDDTVVKVMRDGESTAGMEDYMLEPMEITIMAGATTATANLTAAEDMTEEVMEMLYLYGSVNGQPIASERLMFTIYDAAVPALPIIAQLLLGGLLAFGGFRRYRRR